MPAQLEVEDEEFERALQKKRHGELITAINKIADKPISFVNDNKELAAAFEKFYQSFLDGMKVLQNNSKVVPVAKDNSHKELLDLIRESTSEIVKCMSEMGSKEVKEERPKNWKFIPSYHDDGRIKDVIAKAE